MKQLYYSLSVKEYNGIDFKLFTFTSSEPHLVAGQIVIVPFRTSTSIAVVFGPAPPPSASLKAKLKPIQRVLELPPLPAAYLKLAQWLSDYYVASVNSIWQTMLPSGLGSRPTKLRKTTKLIDTSTNRRLPAALTPAQKKAIAAISIPPTASDPPVLLYGITGSGKTEVYVQAAAKILAEAKSVLLLVPEISLTPQMIEYFSARLSAPLIITHSKLTPAARRSAWLRALQASEPVIVIGARSALFLPLAKLGLIIVDEQHEGGYKQSAAPRYLAAHAAATLAKFSQARLVLGSATPSVTDYYLADKGRLKLISMAERVGGGSRPKVRVVGLRKGEGILSQELIVAITQTLADKKQVLLFLNRRGSANAQICTNCGYTARCRRCEMVVSFHQDKAKLICHLCGLTATPAAICPDCHQIDGLLFVGAGTQKLESLVAETFPEARIARLDKDNASLEGLTTLYTQMKQRRLDILIGTQMIARGLDFEHIRLVGVILADTMLHIPDYGAAERTFQLLTQVVGRAGRTDSQGEAIIQTYTPKSPVILSAQDQDFAKFYQTELTNRARYNYPPFVYLLKVTLSQKRARAGQDLADTTASELRQKYSAIQILGPVQPLHGRSGTGISWQLLIKSRSRKTLVAIARELSQKWTIDLDPITIV